MKKSLLMICASFFAAQLVQANLLKNGSFEEMGSSDEIASQWKMNEPDEHGDAWGSAVRKDWRAHEGSWQGVIQGTWSGMDDYGGFWQEVPGTAGTTYILTAWFYADGSWTANQQELKIEFFNEDRTTQLGSEVVSLSDVSEVWTQKTVEALAPEGTAYVRVVINVSGAGSDGALQVDEVELDTAW
ncbi:MAG: hypothetical protein H7A43_05675 [Verrucomicrobia bacterium]|nr:hypothetical protein [Kiritimatiellia bacterium]MCB1102240.1 hypothetical protein [Kiritimatiellia bacterium]MCP5488120.1 hypothetical protein [Verrucomicrobiota bacterium]